MILGIDPGLGGAIAALTAHSRLDIYDMPTLALTVNGKTRRRIDGHKLAQLIKSLAPAVTAAVLENVHSMPAQGVASSFSFGKAAGAIEQCLVDHNIPYRTVEPAVWKRYFSVTHDKDSSRQRASQLLPAFAGLWPNKSHDGRAEAALLALYAVDALLPSPKAALAK